MMEAGEGIMAGGDPCLSQVGLYIHIPFCRSKCSYCDFNSFSGIEHLAPAYVEATIREIRGWSVLLQRREPPSIVRRPGKLSVATIYFGGGTPTLIDSGSIAAILSACRTSFDVDPNAEVTAEANPGTVSQASLQCLLTAGINRLSIGAQSFNSRLLKLLGRGHSARETAEACRMAFDLGFDNVNLDLIYGIPGQSIRGWKDDLAKALELGPSHLSLYGLSVEDGTPLSARIARGLIGAPDADRSAEMYLWAESILADRGYDHYEISNWALPGRSSEHNLIYWRNLPYIGIGAGAHSSFCSIRLANCYDPAEYIQRMELAAQGEPGEGAAPEFATAARKLCAVEQITELDRSTQMAETAILNLRLSSGLNVDSFSSRYGISVDAVYGGEIEQLCSLGLLERKENALVLTPRGGLLGNEVFARLVSA